MRAVLAAHVAAGASGLVLAWPVLLARKRRGAHTVLGRIYVVALAVMCLTGLVLAAADPAELAGLAVIAVLTLAAALAGVWLARAKPRFGRRGWYVWHLNLMCGSVISFVTAFAVQSSGGHPLAWVVPTLVGSPLIARRTARVLATGRAISATAPSPGGPQLDRAGARSGVLLHSARVRR